MKLALVDRHLAPVLDSLPDVLPSTFVTENGSKEYSIDRQQLEWVIEHGSDASMLAIKENVDLRSSVRLLTIPSQPAFGIYAKKALPGGVPVFTVRHKRRRSAADRAHQW